MYFVLGYKNTEKAVDVLSHAGLKLYLYLSKNKDGEHFPLSSADAMRWTKIKKWDTYSKAVKELESCGFITQKQPESNQFTFCIISSKQPEPEQQPEQETETAPEIEQQPEAEPEAFPNGWTEVQMMQKINAVRNEVAKRKYGVTYNPDLEIDRFDVTLGLSRCHILIDESWDYVLNKMGYVRNDDLNNNFLPF